MVREGEREIRKGRREEITGRSLVEITEVRR
jgi:hypothetical protein